MVQTLLIIFLTQVLFGAAPTLVHAAESSLFKPDSTCARSFIYRNRTHPVDSSRKQDGEGLRFVLSKNAQSEALLNDYQSKIKTSAIPAYVGSVGLALLITGSLYAPTKKSSLGQRDTRFAFTFSGIFLALGSYAYGKWASQSREKALEKAVETYNDAVPEPERIQVDLVPLPNGVGGEIKTQVPF